MQILLFSIVSLLQFFTKYFTVITKELYEKNHNHTWISVLITTVHRQAIDGSRHNFVLQLASKGVIKMAISFVQINKYVCFNTSISKDAITENILKIR